MGTSEPLRTPEVLEGDLRIPARREKYHTHHPRLRWRARERESHVVNFVLVAAAFVCRSLYYSEPMRRYASVCCLGSCSARWYHVGSACSFGRCSCCCCCCCCCGYRCRCCGRKDCTSVIRSCAQSPQVHLAGNHREVTLRPHKALWGVGFRIKGLGCTGMFVHHRGLHCFFWFLGSSDSVDVRSCHRRNVFVDPLSCLATNRLGPKLSGRHQKVRENTGFWLLARSALSLPHFRNREA